MTQKEIEKLKNRVYAISWSKFPLDAFFNDIRNNKEPGFDKESAYKDLKLIVDEFYRLRELEKRPTLEEIKQEWEKLGYVCEEGACHLVLRYKGTNNMIHIWEDHTYRADDWLTFQEHQLLNKTFRALGW